MEKLFCMFAAIIAVGTILYGFRVMKKGHTGNVKLQMLTSLGIFAAMVIGFVVVGGGNVLYAAEAANNGAIAALSVGDGLKYLAAALSTGLATIGTGVAVGSAGSSAIGAVSEDPTILGKTLIFVGMAEGISIYGMIISILILFV